MYSTFPSWETVHLINASQNFTNFCHVAPRPKKPIYRFLQPLPPSNALQSRQHPGEQLLHPPELPHPPYSGATKTARYSKCDLTHVIHQQCAFPTVIVYGLNFTTQSTSAVTFLRIYTPRSLGVSIIQGDLLITVYISLVSDLPNCSAQISN